MTTYRSENPGGLQLDAQGIAQVEAQRKQQGITQEMLERSRNASLTRPF